MTNTIIWTIAIITVLGVLLALVLFLVAKKFKVASVVVTCGYPGIRRR